MAFCSNSGFGRLVDTDVIYTGASITCGGITVNPGDTVREFISVVFLCANDIVVNVEGNSLPIPDGTGNKVAFVGSGTYTQSGGPDIIVPSGHMGILNWDGSVWYLGSSVEMPMPDGEVELGDIRGVSGDTVYKAIQDKLTGVDFGGVVSDGADLSGADGKIYWIATEGTYTTGDGQITADAPLNIIYFNGSDWSVEPIDLSIENDLIVVESIDELRNLSPYHITLLTTGSVKGVLVLGYYEKGDTPAPIIYYLSDTVEDDDGGSIIDVEGVKLESNIIDGGVDVKYFGARGDGQNDDTLYIQNASNYAYNKGKVTTLSTNSQLIFPSNNEFPITDTVEVSEGVDVIMNGRVKYIGIMDRPAIIIGRDNVANRGAELVINVSTIRGDSKWDNEDFVGVILKNSNQCKIDVKLIDGFYIGLKCLGIGQGFAYNQTYIRVLHSNKWGVYLDYQDTSERVGWCNENVFYGGRFSTQSGFNAGESRYGVRVTGDDNRFLYPSFELNRITSAPEHSVAAIFEDAYECSIIHCRNEGNSSLNSDGGYAFIINGDSHNNYIEVGYSFNESRSRLKNAFKDNSNTKQNQYISISNKYTDLQIGDVIYDSGHLPSKWVSTDENVGSCFGTMFMSLEGKMSNFTPDNRKSRKVVENGGVEWVELTRTAFAVRVNTENVKKLGVIRDGRNGRNGVVGIKFFDEMGQEITSPTESFIETQKNNLLPQQVFSYNEAYGGSWTTGIPAPNEVPVFFTVKEEVKEIILLIGSYNSRASIRSFKILSLEDNGRGVTVLSNTGYNTSGNKIIRSNYPPSYGTYLTREVVYTDSGERGGNIGFLCNSYGTATPINATGKVSGNMTVSEVVQATLEEINVGDRLSVNGDSRVVKEVGQGSITFTNNLNITVGETVNIENIEPSWISLGVKDMSKVSGDNPNGMMSGISGTLLHGISASMSSTPLWVKTTGVSSDQGWERVLISGNGGSITDVIQPHASDLQTAIDLVNEIKDKTNDILSALRSSGVIE